MKTAIIYASVHHGNTKKLVEAMAEGRNIDVFSVAEAGGIDLSPYENIGFASGIYAWTFHKSLLRFIEKAELQREQNIFLVYTCGIDLKDYSKKVREILRDKRVNYLGCFHTRGFDTFAFLRFFGGIAKGRPNQSDFKNGKIFLDSIGII